MNGATNTRKSERHTRREKGSVARSVIERTAEAVNDDISQRAVEGARGELYGHEHPFGAIGGAQ